MKDPVVVLLVEDEEAHAAIVRWNFEKCRIANQVMHVADGPDALDYLYQRNGFSDPADSPRPGIILLDLRLPKLDGMEVLKTIKADRNLRSIPVVILTTSTSDETRSEALARHASAFMSKSDLFYSRSDEMMAGFSTLMTEAQVESSKTCVEESRARIENSRAHIEQLRTIAALSKIKIPEVPEV